MHSQNSQVFRVVYRATPTSRQDVHLSSDSEDEREHGDTMIPSNQLAAETTDSAITTGEEQHRSTSFPPDPPPVEEDNTNEDEEEWSFLTQYIGPPSTRTSRREDTIVEDEISSFRLFHLNHVPTLLCFLTDQSTSNSPRHWTMPKRTSQP